MENFIVSALKYRPQSFKDVVGQSAITTTLEKAIKDNVTILMIMEYIAAVFLNKENSWIYSWIRLTQNLITWADSIPKTFEQATNINPIIRDIIPINKINREIRRMFL